MTAHWGIPDPAALEGTKGEKSLAFQTALESLERRIKAFVSLPIATLEKRRLQAALAGIG